VWGVALDRRFVVPFDFCDEFQGFGRQPSGVEGEDADRQAFTPDDLGQHHVLGAEAGGEHDGIQLAADLGQQLDGRGLAGWQGVGRYGRLASFSHDSSPDGRRPPTRSRWI
jgi:hypothetical protein